MQDKITHLPFPLSHPSLSDSHREPAEPMMILSFQAVSHVYVD